ncbi:imelysin family protein [Flavitalea sp.]|nr:imelysin family protein [Flavitalea sp.]
MNKFKVITAIAFSAILVYACSKSDSGSGDKTDSGDAFKKQMLINYADTLILPAYVDLQSKIALFEETANAFLNAPSVITRETLKTPYKNAYISFQGISALYFGPAAALQLNNTINTFPSASAKIEAAIQTGSYDFTQVIAADSIQGFPALDYLLFSPDAVQQFNGANAEKRKKYVKDIVTRMKTLISATIAQWNGGFRESFVSSMQTNVGSSIGSLVNQFAFEMDALKGPRIGWPFGKQSNGIVFADKCEGYFSGISRDLAIANLTSLKKYFSGGQGTGIADYLVLLNKSQLNNDVITQFDIAIGALQVIPDPMSAAFTGNAPAIENAYREVQKLLTLIKTDVASATAVQITYMDNDGD